MKHWTIQTRMLLMALLPGLLVALTLGVFFIIERGQDLDDLLSQRAMSMAKQLAPTCEYGVMTGNPGILQNIVNNMLEEQDVRAISVYGQNMQSLAHAGPKMLHAYNGSPELQKDQLQLLHTPGSIRVRAPIFAENLVISDQISDQFYAEEKQPNRLLGWAEVELSISNTQLQHYQRIVAAIGIVTLVLLLGSILAYRITRQISHPVQRLIQAAGDISDGKLDTRVRINSNREFEQLGSAINSIASTLQQNQTEHQKHIEQATRDLQETLDELEVRNSELQIGRRQALETSKMKSRFLANVSHEIRTPLNGIIGFTDLLSRTQLGSLQRDYLDTIHKSSRDLLNIINDILDLSKIDADKLIIEDNPCHLRSIVEQVLTVMAPLAYQKDLELYYHISADTPEHICGDALRLKQVLTNLVNNAVKFTNRGKVTVLVSTISLHNQRATLQFEVQDTGIGLSKEQMQRIFHAFSQADSSTARQFGGTGLGLIISKALVNAMHGDIRVESQQGEGATFTFHIDVRLNQPDEQDDQLTELKDGWLLVHEPDVLNQQALTSLLEKHRLNYKLADSQSVILGLATGTDKPAALMISIDRKQLYTSGLETWLGKLTQLSLPVIAMLNSVQHQHQEWLMTQGIRRVLTYPLVQQRLLQTLQELLSNTGIAVPALAMETPQQPPPPYVLAVDDNEANLKLVTTLLAELGVQVTAAASGQQAIDIVCTQPVDLIFMDIQMPQMNGLEASQRIRGLPDKGALPIVALTAHALSDEKDVLLNSGLNDYQTKPISLEQLADCIRRWTGYRSTRVDQPPGFMRLPASRATDIVNLDESLRLANHSAKLANELFSMLLTSLDQDMESIREQWENEDYTSLLEMVHKVHGATRYCGVPSLRTVLYDLESAIKGNQHELLPDLMRCLIEEAQNLQHWAASHDWHDLFQRDNTANA